MDDTISRQAAIDALADYIHNIDRVYSTGKLSAEDCNNAAHSVLDELPSAQPDIIRCKDCDWWTKQEDSLQGRCALLQIYPTGGWFCGSAERRKD